MDTTSSGEPSTSQVVPIEPISPLPISTALVRRPSAVVLDVTSPSPPDEVHADNSDSPDIPKVPADPIQLTDDIADASTIPNNAHSYHKLNLDQQKDFWAAHNQQAAGYDEKLILRLKEGLDTLLIFVGHSSLFYILLISINTCLGGSVLGHQYCLHC